MPLTLRSSVAESSAWRRLINSRAGIPAGRVVGVPEALDSPQVRHRELLQTFHGAPGVGRETHLFAEWLDQQAALG